jgi:Mrp family chromosome partitioning ATPase
MVDLSKEMAELAEGLKAGATSHCRVLQFVSALAGEGTSTVAREFARYMSERSQLGVWLIELDLLRGAQFASLKAEQTRYGVLGTPTRASVDGSMFFDLSPKLTNSNGQPWPNAGYLDAYPVGQARWWVTRFRREALRPGQSVRILSSPDYWRMLRQYSDWIIIDAPSAQRSRAALATAAYVDDNVMVVSGDSEDISSAVALRDGLKSVGGRCAGLVFNRAPKEAPPFLQTLLR